jgi:pimeloyl-ACP methyl ester carboxylesterase
MNRNGSLIEREGFHTLDGNYITLWRWPHSKERPTLHWAHATGFHGRMYRPLLDELSSSHNILAWDMRGHGVSAGAANKSTFLGWETYYQDLISLLLTMNEPIWLAGHSIGATASMVAAARMPDKVLGVVLVEPVIMDYWQGSMLWLSKLLGRSHNLSLAAGAARRREIFDSYACALDNYRNRGGFKTWPELWLEEYVNYAFVPQGDHIRLACLPEWESLTFSHTEHNPWPEIRRLSCPVITIAAEQGSTFSLPARSRFRKLLPFAEVHELAETTHFLPMERTQMVCEIIRELR